MAGFDISILIPARNRAELTRVCLDALERTLPAGRAGISFEVLVRDDGSTDSTPAILEEFVARDPRRRRVIADAPTGSFAINMNRLVADARGRWLVLLNNDTIPRPGWLEPMLETAEHQPRAALIGNLHLFPQRRDRPSPAQCRINHAGVVFDAAHRPLHLYEGMPEDLPAAGLTRPVQAVSAACWLVAADLWRDLGGFDEHYRNGHEDLDVCMRAQAEGYEVWYDGRSRIEHHGSSTPGRFAATPANHDRFVSAWGHRLRADLETVTASDGVAWPARSRSYLAARALWRWPPLHRLARLALSTRAGVRLRQAILRRLVTTHQTDKRDTPRP